MPYFSKRSEKKLETCHIKLITICRTVIQDFDFSVLCGYRGEREQNELFNKGRSQVRFPNSRHNKIPSLAVDIAPYLIDWNDLDRFIELSGRIKETAYLLGYEIEWGGDWKTFRDYPHYQIVT